MSFGRFSRSTGKIVETGVQDGVGRAGGSSNWEGWCRVLCVHVQCGAAANGIQTRRDTTISSCVTSVRYSFWSESFFLGGCCSKMYSVYVWFRLAVLDSYCRHPNNCSNVSDLQDNCRPLEPVNQVFGFLSLFKYHFNVVGVHVVAGRSFSTIYLPQTLNPTAKVSVHDDTTCTQSCQ
jgi:hypothetical protein